MKYIKIHGPDDRYIHTMREDGIIVNKEDIPDDSEIIESRMTAFLPPEQVASKEEVSKEDQTEDQ